MADAVSPFWLLEPQPAAEHGIVGHVSGHSACSEKGLPRT
jgi:hypothetical protein